VLLIERLTKELIEEKGMMKKKVNMMLSRDRWMII